MITKLLHACSKIAKTSLIAIMAVVLLTQSTVSAQSAGLATKSAENEIKALVAKMKTEVDRRLTETEKATKSLESSNSIASSSKKTIATALTASKTALEELKKQISEVKDLKTAKELAAKVDGQYDQYTNANATAQTMKDGSLQQEGFTQLQLTASDTQAMIDAAAALGKEVANMQQHMNMINQLIQSIGAIITSVILLITSLASGNFSGAFTVFQTILSQLSQNIAMITTAQVELGGIVDALNGFQGLTAGASTPSK